QVVLPRPGEAQVVFSHLYPVCGPEVQAPVLIGTCMMMIIIGVTQHPKLPPGVIDLDDRQERS
ncbi:MAG TPA: hypothetical protein PKJ21_07370, partial [Anaerolineae bacterium]|nr:hypothetical protein [Anaerolineae bacterium]